MMDESQFNSLGFGRPQLGGQPTQIEHVLIERPLRRVLAFTQHTIDEVINNPIARRRVAAFYKLHCWVARETEIAALEGQWNSLGQLGR